uniref:Uncharacterized protein n=1 Tax=Seriola dumerili TaxID=41447 RepID=A0A3B4T9M0_SERDU
PASNPIETSEVSPPPTTTRLCVTPTMSPTEDYYLLADTWKQDGRRESGAASPENHPRAVSQVTPTPSPAAENEQLFYIFMSLWKSRSDVFVSSVVSELSAEAMCRYDHDMDLYYLCSLYPDREEPIDELTMERAMEALEEQCHDNMNPRHRDGGGSGIEYDEKRYSCNICACYSIVKVPRRKLPVQTCVLGLGPALLPCGYRRKNNKQATFLPSLRMEPITQSLPHPTQRCSLICSLPSKHNLFFLSASHCFLYCKELPPLLSNVTCAFEHSLEMKHLGRKGMKVKFKSYPQANSKSKAGRQSLAGSLTKPPVERRRWPAAHETAGCLEEEPVVLAAIRFPDHINTHAGSFLDLASDLDRRVEAFLLHLKPGAEFNLHVQLMNQERLLVQPFCLLRICMFRPPPRIDNLKVKFPILKILNGKSQSGNGRYCPDKGKPQVCTVCRRRGRSNGLLWFPQALRTAGAACLKPTAKLRALPPALHGHSEVCHWLRKDSSCQATPSDQDASKKLLERAAFCKSAMEALRQVIPKRLLRGRYQTSDGYCPDLSSYAPRKGVSPWKQSLGSRDPMQSDPMYICFFFISFTPLTTHLFSLRFCSLPKCQG